MDGASLHMAPLAYPAVADYELVHKLVSGVKGRGFPYHIGITASSDTFYQGQSRQDSYLKGFVHQEIANRFSELKALKVLSFEMECATLFTQCATYGLSAAAILGVLLNRNRNEFPSEASAAKTEERVIQAALTCIGSL
jgi:uridine phosphorylase